MSTFNAIEKPVVNLNGTSAGQLLESYMDALAAIRAARAALTKTQPHGRDYQLSHPDRDSPQVRYERARNQHVERMGWLEQIESELEELAEHVVLAMPS